MIRRVLLSLAISILTAGHVMALTVATGFSDRGQPRDPASWMEAVREAAQAARKGLGEARAEVVIVWDNIPVPDALAESAILPAIAAEFPGAVICGQHERARPQYSPYTQQGTTVGPGISLMAISGARAQVVHVVSGDSDAAPKDQFLAKIQELGDALRPLPEDGRLLVIMGAFHGKGEVLAQGLRNTLGDVYPVVGGSSGGNGAIYHEGKVIPRAVQAILLRGDFAVDIAGSRPMGDWEPQYTQEIKARAEADTLGRALKAAADAGRTPRGIIWFNCQGRCEQPDAFYERISIEQRQARRSLHVDAVRAVAGGLPFWGHFSGAEIGPVEARPRIEGGGYRAVFAVLSGK